MTNKTKVKVQGHVQASLIRGVTELREKMDLNRKTVSHDFPFDTFPYPPLKRRMKSANLKLAKIVIITGEVQISNVLVYYEMVGIK